MRYPQTVSFYIKRIIFGDGNLLSWDVLIIDTDHHTFNNIIKMKIKKLSFVMEIVLGVGQPFNMDNFLVAGNHAKINKELLIGESKT